MRPRFIATLTRVPEQSLTLVALQENLIKRAFLTSIFGSFLGAPVLNPSANDRNTISTAVKIYRFMTGRSQQQNQSSPFPSLKICQNFVEERRYEWCRFSLGSLIYMAKTWTHPPFKNTVLTNVDGAVVPNFLPRPQHSHHLIGTGSVILHVVSVYWPKMI